MVFHFTKKADSDDPKAIIQQEILEKMHDLIPNETLFQLENDALKTQERNANLSFFKAVEIAEAEKLSDTKARLVLRFPVGRSYLNPSKALQGGQQAVMFDIGTTWLLTILGKPGFWERMGTTRTLTVTCIRPALEGKMLRLEAKTVNVGKRLALLKGVLMREEDGAIISTCEHDKYNDDNAYKL